jgi:molybdopterin-binding protein
VTVPWPDGVAVEPIDDVLATLAPADVALHAARPEGSARNVIQGRVEEVAILGDRARVRLNGSPRLVAEITTGSVARMAIRTGDVVWASFKAVEIHLMVERRPTDTL